MGSFPFANAMLQSRSHLDCSYEFSLEEKERFGAYRKEEEDWVEESGKLENGQVNWVRKLPFTVSGFGITSLGYLEEY